MIGSLKDRPLEREPNPLPEPILVEADQLVMLGEIGGHQWFRFKRQKDGDEYELTGRAIPDRGPAVLTPGAVYVEAFIDGRRVWQPTKRWPAGTYQNGGRLPPPPPKPAKPSRPVDELLRFWPRKAESMTSVGLITRDVDETLDAQAYGPYIEIDRAPRLPNVHHLYKPAVPAPRGPAEILDRLAKRGIELKPSADGELYVVAPAGALDYATRDAIEAARPLLRPYLHGTPARCALPHDGEPPLAVTIVTGGALSCGEH